MEKEHEVLFIKGLRRKKLRFGVLPDSSLCQNGKQVEIITKMIFELCYIEAIYYYAHGSHRSHGFFAKCFSTTEMTDLTDFVSIACSLRYWLVAADRYLTT